MKSQRSVSVDVTTMLLIVFVTLKLTGLIDWSWWWVLAPLWIPLAIVASLFIVALFIVSIKK